MTLISQSLHSKAVWYIIPSRGSKRRHDDDDTPLSKRATTFDKDRVEVFLNKSGRVGVSINEQKIRKKNVRKDSFI